MADIFKPKRGSHNVIARINPLLEEGEVVFEYPESGNRGLGLIKMGDGVHRYNDLPVFVVTITDYIPIEEKGAPNGIAPLNPAGKVDADYLPSYVDDVLEYPHREDFPVPGEKGKIYVDTSTEWNNIYRWSGTVYICIGTSVKYELKQNKNVIRLEGSDSSVNRVDVTQIYEYDGIEDFPYPGKSGCIYVATSAIYNNLYRWDDTDRRYVGCANMNSYALIKNGPTITLMSSDGTDSSISSEILEYNSVSQFPAQGILNTLYIDISTTENNTYRWTGSEYVHITTSVKYLIAKDENYLKLTGSDGSEIDLQNDVLFYETKAQFPTEDPEDPSTTISRFKFFVDYSTNSIYRWDGTQYVLINGDTTYTLSRADNKITLKTTVAGVDSTTSIPTSVYIWNDGTHYRPTTGQVGILYINDGKPLDNNLWKWTGTNYAVVAGDTRYSIIKDTTDHLLGLRAYRPDDSTTDIWHIDTSVQLFDSTSSFKPYAYKDIIYVDKSKDRNNLYVADSSSHFTLVGGDTQYDLTSDNKDIKLVSSEGSTDTIPKSVSYYNSTSAFPTTGSINIIYVDKNNVRNNLYLWDTSKSKYEVISGNDNYSLDKNTLNQLRLLLKPNGTSTVQGTFIYDRDVMIYNGTNNFPTTGKQNIIYVDTSKVTNNEYRWDTATNKYKIVGSNATYGFTISNATDGSEKLIVTENTYTSAGNATTITTTLDIKDTISYYRMRNLFPTTGHLDMIYVDIGDDKVYIWNALNEEYEEILSGTDFVKATISKSGDTITLTNQYTGTTKTSTIKTDVIEGAGKANFPNPGTTNTLYVDTSKKNNNLYRWDTTQYVNVADDTKYTFSKSGTTDTITIVGKNNDGNTTTTLTEIRYSIAKSTTNLVSLVGKVGNTTANITTFTDSNTTYSISKDGGSIKLSGSDGSESSVSGVGGVEIRTTDPSGTELYAGKMWIKI